MRLKHLTQPDIKLIFIIGSILLFFPLIVQLTLSGDNQAFGFPLPIVVKGVPQCMMGSPCEPYIVFFFSNIVYNVLISSFVIVLLLLFLNKLQTSIKSSFLQPLLLTVFLFITFTIVSLIFSVSYPLIKGRSIGLPLYYLVGPPIYNVKNIIFMQTYLLYDLLYWYFVSNVIIWIYSKYKSKVL